LSQAGEQRFAVQDSKERWSALEAPAGTERLNRLRERLGTRGVTSAFNRRAKESQDAVTRAEQDIRSWDDLLERRNAAKRLAESAGAMSQAELLPMLERLRAEVAGHFGDLNFSDASSPESCLRQLAHKIDSEKPRVAVRLEAIKALEAVPRQWRQVLDDAAKCHATLTARDNQLRDARIEVERLHEQVEQERTRLAQEAQELERIAQDRSRISRVTMARNSLEELQGAEASLRAQIADARGVLDTTSVTARETAAHAEERRRLEREFVAAGERFEAVRELHGLHVRCAKAEADAKDAAAKHEEAKASGSGLGDEHAEIERDRALYTQALQAAEQRLQRLRFQATTIESCVASLAAVITDEDTKCPLCSTEFEAGELKRLVSATANLAGDGLAAAEAGVELARVAIRSLEPRVAALEARRIRLAQAARAATSAQAAADALLATLRLHPLLATSPVGVTVGDRIASLQAEARSRLEDMSAQVRDAVSTTDLDKAFTEADIAKRTADSTLAELRDGLAKVQSSILETQAVLNPVDAVAADTQAADRLAELAILEGTFLASQEAGNKRHGLLAAQFRSATTTSSTIETELRSTKQHSADLQRLLETLRSSWAKANLVGDPSAEALLLELNAISDRQQRLAEYEARSRSLIEGHASWSKADEFRVLQEQIAETTQRAGCKSEAEVRPALDIALAVSRAKSQQTEDSRTFRDQMIKKLEAEVRQYANKVLAPLNSLNENYLRVFSCFSNLTVSMGAKTQQASVKLEFVLKWLAGTADSGSAASIRHFLSEGQLSALSVSLLLSMSTAYRWSQWRALVLDDPLQHNDVIHATSFIEVLRNLVRLQGYQVLLSTHDLELADFIRRKMDAASVDCRTCQFLGTRQSGVRYKVT
jgi:exonuclease SbcC